MIHIRDDAGVTLIKTETVIVIYPFLQMRELDPDDKLSCSATVTPNDSFRNYIFVKGRKIAIIGNT